MKINKRENWIWLPCTFKFKEYALLEDLLCVIFYSYATSIEAAAIGAIE